MKKLSKGFYLGSIVGAGGLGTGLFMVGVIRLGVEGVMAKAELFYPACSCQSTLEWYS